MANFLSMRIKDVIEHLSSDSLLDETCCTQFVAHDHHMCNHSVAAVLQDISKRYVEVDEVKETGILAELITQRKGKRRRRGRQGHKG